MGEGKEPSFGWLVIRRAWFGAWGLFDSWRKDTAIGTISVFLGEAQYYRLHGLPSTAEDFAVNAAHLIVPIVIVWVALFLWHFWLAPSALAYEAAKQAAKTPAPQGASQAKPQYADPLSSVNWSVWKARENYTLPELAAILAKIDPAKAKEDGPGKAFLKLLQEETMGRKLAYWRDRNAEGYFQPDIWPSYFSIKRTDALTWAKSKGFDTSHID